jgi:hypothetical protein
MVGVPRFFDEHDAFFIASRIKSRFEKEAHLKWLLIFDNADQIGDLHDPHSIVDLILKGQNGGVLATTRNRASDSELASAGSEIEEMTENEAIELLSKGSRIKMSQDDK